jgi:hypothetical protein
MAQVLYVLELAWETLRGLLYGKLLERWVL